MVTPIRNGRHVNHCMTPSNLIGSEYLSERPNSRAFRGGPMVRPSGLPPAGVGGAGWDYSILVLFMQLGQVGRDEEPV